MLLSEVSKTIDIKKILHQKSNKHFNKINSSSKEVDKKTIFIIDSKKKIKKEEQAVPKHPYKTKIETKEIKIKEIPLEKSKFVAVNTQLNSSNLGFHVISKYIGAHFITINETEMRHELRNKNEHRLPLIKTLSKKLKSKYTHVTSGDRGSIIYNSTLKKIISCPAFASKVMDKVGTGDTMLAILAISLFKKFNIKFSMFLSALAAAQNIQYMANKIPINKVNITRALQSYLK